MDWTTFAITLISAILASNGLWALISNVWQSKNTKESAEAEMLKGLGHDRITYLGEKYIEQGYITKDEYENLNDYLYKPYKKLGGNGTAEKVMKEVDKLPIRNKKEV